MAIVHANEETFDTEVLEAEGPVLVDFWAAWCGPCVALGKLLDDLSEKYDTVKVVKVDVQSNMGLATQYGVTSIPHVAVFRNGEQISRTVGFSGRTAVEEMFEELSGS